ncbi:sterol desaturase family protein [Arenibacter sp. GZD96]|uniref:sterol desaturase family protein n=1 Tax=Aurantibrevibacter litoralis TaxID=3106030 RepID=UPI002AFF8C63|nr:sterol desaturase family protein [Arenibacter sp. GZD-96]MEA1784834.1 sterol desaturase family protein [Arenibacter sp. GZD-96]
MHAYNYAALSIPLFFVFVYLETIFLKRSKKKDAYRFESAISNLSIGITERYIHLFVGIGFYQFFVWVYSHFALFTIATTWYTWIALLLAADFTWYWYHRLGHQINLFWAAHIVHHQSEDFNFTAAARITTFQAFIRYGFWGLLPFIGFHPDMVVSILLIHGVYSFFTHTESIGKLPWLEHIFITPSLHGVHHASNEKYLDKNYGDVFVFWDKLFGTFQKEEEKPVYGLTHPLKSYSFLWQHFHYYLELFEAFRRGTHFKEKWNALFGSPAQMDQNIRPFLEKKFMQHKDTKRFNESSIFRNYLSFQLATCVLILTGATFAFDLLSGLQKLFFGSFLLITLINCGALLEQRKWIYTLEIIRAHLLTISLTVYFDVPYVLPYILLLLIIVPYVTGAKERYHKLMLS